MADYSKYGSVAVVERFTRTLKGECTRRLPIPYQPDAFHRELVLFFENSGVGSWFDALLARGALGSR